MTTEQLREKNNASETKNLKTYKSLLDRAEQLINDAKSLDGGGSDSGSSDDSDVGDSAGGDKKKSADKWKDDIRKAAKAMGVKITDKDVDGIASLIQKESGGDPKIKQQIKDINSGGNEAQGLLQYVPSTFNNYKVKGHGNIHNGYDQLLAFFNNKNWKSDYNPNGGWSPTGGRAKGGKGGRFSAPQEPVSPVTSALLNNTAPLPTRSSNSNSMSSNVNNNNNVRVNVNVQGNQNNSEELGEAVESKFNNVMNTDLSIFSNQYRRV